jgi:hypothetical protein
MQVSNRSWENERLFTFGDLARQPNLPIQKSHWVFRHWAKNGLELRNRPPGRNGRHQKAKLPSVRIGHLRYTSIEALREFVRNFITSQE